uniref:Uncharacterized protein n=1 Tax=Amphora coffeiformis TaxID=265554 RepID=A0A7S3L978_9STRA|eukprot:scaffold2043_cov166-Amphora_coffeaeformis.AAC.28
MNFNEKRKTANTFWPSEEPLSKWCDRSHPDTQDTSAAETTEVDEMSSEPFYMNDADSLTGFFEDDQFPIQGGLEKLDLMDTATTDDERDVAATSTTRTTLVPPASEFYDHIQALMYGMNKLAIDHDNALELARRYPLDPVMVAVQALLHRDEAAADALWRKANQLGISSKVEQGCGLVQALVGRMLENGVGGVLQDSRRAEFWYNQAAKKGHAVARCFLGLFHVKACEYDKALYWLEQAALQGHARAQMHFGLLFEHGHVGKQGRRDYEKAKAWYEKASKQGDAKATCRLGYLVRRSNHTNDGLFDLSYLMTEELVETSVPEGEKQTEAKFTEAADPIDYEPLNARAEVCKTFLPVEENDDVIAVKSQWLDTQGSSKKRRLENVLEVQKRISRPQTIALETPNIAEPQDSVSASIVGHRQHGDTNPLLPSPDMTQDPYYRQFNLKSLYFMETEGAPVSDLQLYDNIEALLYGMNKAKIDQEAALQLARQHPSDPVMICIQALLHRDEISANALWKRANELGISSRVELGGGLVQALVGKMLENGVGGVKENLRRAEFWYNQAAKKGHATAQFFLGLFHVKDGEYDRARFWLERAAKQGHARAQMHFGLLFEHSRDFETAKFWYKKAVDQGDAKAECRLDFVEGKRRHDALNHMDTPALMSDPPYKNFAQKAAVNPTAGAMEPNHFRQDANDQSTRQDVSCTNLQGLATSTTEPAWQQSLIGLVKNVKCATTVCPVLDPDVIKPYCAVMGDKSTRGARLTMGTKVLREVKEWFRENRIVYQEAGRETALYEEAMQRYFTRMADSFADFPADRLGREQTLLVKCTKKSLESDRVEKPNCFRYASDKSCQYGTAKLPLSILFYFDSRDPPKLDAEVTKYRRKLGTRPDLQGKRREYFERYLDFCAMTAGQAADGCPTAQLAVESTNFIPALKKIWEDLEKS